MNQADLPVSLQGQLRAFERRLRAVETVQAVCLILASVLAAHLLLFGLDRLGDSPPLLRWALLLISSFALLGAWAWWLRRWWWQRRSQDALAVMIQRHHRGLGDRLQGVIELVRDPDPDLSPGLRDAAIRQVSRSCEAYDFRAAVETRRSRQLLLLAALLITLAGLLFLALPHGALITWKRLLAPWSPQSRYTLAHLEPLPDTRVVLHGEPFSLPVALAAESRWQPRQVTARLQGTVLARDEMRDGQAELTFSGITESGQLEVQAGDARATLQLQAVHRPALRQLSAGIRFPDYLAKEPAKIALDTDTITLIEGASIQVRGLLDRAPEQVTMLAPTRSDLARQGHHFHSPWLPVDKQLDLSLTWQDAYGFGPLSPRELSIHPEADAPPTLRAPGLDRNLAMLVDESLPISFVASDDHGVREINLTWTVTGPQEEALGNAHQVRLAQGAADQTDLQGDHLMAPLVQGIPAGSKVTITATTTDFLPGREPVSSPVYRLFVLSHDQHARLVREQFERLQSGLANVIRSEETLLAGKRALADQPDEMLLGEAGEQELGDQLLDERVQTQDLAQLSHQAKELLQEAMRNPSFDPKLFRQWSELAQQMQNIADQQMPQLQESLQQAKQSTEQRRDQLARAIEQQEEILEQLRQQREASEEALESMVIDSFVTRLRQAASEEQAITAAMAARVSDTIGLRFDQLSEGLRGMLEQQAKRQRHVQQSAGEVVNDLRGFHARTGFHKYGDVFNAMEAAKVPEALADPADLMLVNRTGQAISLTGEWSERFTAWADQLQALSNQSGQSGGDGPSQDVQMEVILTLLRLLQEQATIRSITRQLDRQQDEDDYRQRARQLSARQMDAFTELGTLEQMIQSMQLTTLFDQVGMAMMDASLFLRIPQTDSEPIAAQTEAIEVLASLISQGSEQMAQQNPQMAALMMQMLGAMQGQQQQSGGPGGGGTNGGTSDAPNLPVDGPATGSGAERRTGERASGTWHQQPPAEFRDALQHYYRALEALQQEASP